MLIELSEEEIYRLAMSLHHSTNYHNGTAAANPIEADRIVHLKRGDECAALERKFSEIWMANWGREQAARAREIAAHAPAKVPEYDDR